MVYNDPFVLYTTGESDCNRCCIAMLLDRISSSFQLLIIHRNNMIAEIQLVQDEMDTVRTLQEKNF